MRKLTIQNAISSYYQTGSLALWAINTCRRHMPYIYHNKETMNQPKTIRYWKALHYYLGRPDHLSRSWTKLQLSLLFKVKKLWQSSNDAKWKYISLLLHALSLDIEPSPGPIQTHVYLEGTSIVFPCGSYERAACHPWSCKWVECDACFIWYHADCHNINNSMTGS